MYLCSPFYFYVTDFKMSCFLPLKLLAVVGPAFLNHVNKVVCQDERHSLPVDPKFALKVPQEVAKVNVE